MSLSAAFCASASLANSFFWAWPVVPRRPKWTVKPLPSTSMAQNFLLLPSVKWNSRRLMSPPGAQRAADWKMSLTLGSQRYQVGQGLADGQPVHLLQRHQLLVVGVSDRGVGAVEEEAARDRLVVAVPHQPEHD